MTEPNEGIGGLRRIAREQDEVARMNGNRVPEPPGLMRALGYATGVVIAIAVLLLVVSAAAVGIILLWQRVL